MCSIEYLKKRGHLDARKSSRLQVQEIHVQTVPVSKKDLLIDYLNSPGHQQHSSIISHIISTDNISLSGWGRRYWTHPSSPLRSVAGELLCALSTMDLYSAVCFTTHCPLSSTLRLPDTCHTLNHFDYCYYCCCCCDLVRWHVRCLPDSPPLAFASWLPTPISNVY